MSSRQLTEWMAYFAGKTRVDDIVRDGEGQVDAALAWSMVWGTPEDAG
jgi:hypothetical protein